MDFNSCGKIIPPQPQDQQGVEIHTTTSANQCIAFINSFGDNISDWLYGCLYFFSRPGIFHGSLYTELYGVINQAIYTQSMLYASVISTILFLYYVLMYAQIDAQCVRVDSIQLPMYVGTYYLTNKCYFYSLSSFSAKRFQTFLFVVKRNLVLLMNAI